MPTAAAATVTAVTAIATATATLWRAGNVCTFECMAQGAQAWLWRCACNLQRLEVHSTLFQIAAH